MLRFLKITFKVSALIILLVAAIQLCSFPYFYYHTRNPKKADLIIAFDGDERRTASALSLAHKGFCNFVAATNTTRAKLASIAKNLPGTGEITLLDGGKSRSTFEDVRSTEKIIENDNLSSVMLVTSSYHMPRALFLLHTYLLLSAHGKIDIEYYAVQTEEKIDLRYYYNEMVKIWGSIAEMIGYKMTRIFLNDNSSLFKKIREFGHTYLLFRV